MAKSAAKKLMGMTMAPGSTAFGKGDAVPLDRREQRKLDQSLGLVPFACKLNGELVATLQAQAKERGVDLNELVGELLTKGLAA
jgi:hypothetical protein